MNKWLLIVLLVLAIPLTLNAQDVKKKATARGRHVPGSDIAVTYPIFESAYVEQNNLKFKPFVEVDWSAQSPARIKSINIKTPSRTDLEYIKSGEEFYGYYSFHFDLAVSPEINKGFYYLATTAGVLELKLSKLRGTARFELDEKGTAITSVVYYGEIVADTSAEQKIKEGGFVMFSINPLKATTHALTSESNQLFTAQLKDHTITFSYKEKDQGRDLSSRAEHPTEILTSYKINLEGISSNYIFVRWDEDRTCNYGCCSMNYSLFEVTQSLREVRRTNFNCDI